jgi:thiol-disulfide isomerase/thioredoxin
LLVPKSPAVAALLASLSVLLTPAPAHACDGATTLANAARAYRHRGALFATAHYLVQVPGAPPHPETTEFGFDPRRTAYLRMPGLYVMAVQDGQLVLASDSGTAPARVLEQAAGADLQAAIDAAFEGHGAPLVPVPLLLRAAHGTEDELQAFRSRLLQRLALGACRRLERTPAGQVIELTLEAANGSVRARFDADSSFLTGYDAQIATERGAPPVTAEVSFEPHGGALPGDLLAGLARPVERVAHFAELTGDEPPAPTAPLRASGLRTLDGQPFALDRLSGEPVILEFWARWCPPCRLTLPAMEHLALWARTNGLPVHIVLVNTEEGFASEAAARPEVERYLRWAQLSLPTALDLDGSFHRRFGGGLPLTVVVSPQGEVAARHGGFDPQLEESLQREVRRLLR